MARAIWNGQVVAESDTTEFVEGNHYFPPEGLNKQFFTESSTTSFCGWKGTASYYTLEVDGKQNVDAAWCYADPKEKAENIKGHIAFWKGVTIEETPSQNVNESDAGGACSLDDQ